MLLALLGCFHALRPDMPADEVVEAHTSDGWTLPIHHHRGEGPPLLMVHGLGANHFNFDWRREVSLAAYLQDQGWDVWVPALRGDVDASGPTRSYTFDDHAARDIPAILDTVLRVTGAAKVYWVGHSMGGILLYTTLSTIPERVAAGVAIGSPASFEGPTGLHVVARDNPWALAGGGRFPFRVLGRATGWLGNVGPTSAFLAAPGSLPADVVAGLSHDALTDVPRALARQANTWLTTGELVRVDGSPWLRRARVPMLALGMSEDHVVPWWYVVTACRWTTPCEFRLIGKAGGFERDWGHIDPVLAADARTTVWPLIADWLGRTRGRLEGARGAPPAPR